MEVRDVIDYLAGELSSFYGIACVVDENKVVGDCKTFIDAYSMEPSYIRIGSKSSGNSYECDMCSAIISIYHEFRHAAQLMCLQDDSLRLSGLSDRGTSLVVNAFTAVQPYVGNDMYDYYDKNYRVLPYEIDAERFGTKFGMNFVESVFGKEFLNKGMKERFSKLSEKDYPGSLPIAKLVAGSKLGLSEMFKLYFAINALPTAMDRYKTLLDINVEKGVTSPIIAEKCDIRKSRYNVRDVSFVGNYEVDVDDLFEFDDEYD